MNGHKLQLGGLPYVVANHCATMLDLLSDDPTELSVSIDCQFQSVSVYCLTVETTNEEIKHEVSRWLANRLDESQIGLDEQWELNS